MEKDDISITRVSLEIPKNKQASIRISNTQPKPYYFQVGNGILNKQLKETGAMDLIKEMSKMTPQELWFVGILRDNLKPILYQNKLVTTVKTSIKDIEFTDSEKQRIKTAYKRLSAKNILIRTRNQHYMFNPDFIIPHLYKEEKEEYESYRAGSKNTSA